MDLKGGGTSPNVPQHGHLQEVRGFNAYATELKRYAVDASGCSETGPPGRPLKPSEAERSVVDPDAIPEEGESAGGTGPSIAKGFQRDKVENAVTGILIRQPAHQS